MNKKIKVCSLFSGIGGFETGVFETLGKDNVDVVFSSEIDKYASFAYENLYNHKPHGDITKVSEKDIPDHDLLVAGFPCQAFSIAGKRLGFEDTRGTLFFEIARIAKEKKPKVMLLENVKGLLSHNKGQTLETIMKVLSDLDYYIDFTILNSKFFGVPQNRERIFIVAARDQKLENWIIPKGNGVLSKSKKELSQLEGIKMFNFNFPQELKVETSLKDILEKEVQNRYFLNEERLKQFVSNGKELEGDIKKVGYIKNNREQNRVHNTDGIMPTITANNQGGRRPGGLILDGDLNDLKQVGYIDKNSQGNRVYSEDGLSATIASQTGGLGGSGGGVYLIKEMLESEIREIVKKSRPNEEISINFKENGDIRPHRNDKKKSGISELNINFEENTSFTVTASHAPKIYGASTSWKIRKLTPLECFRLQGFPDEYHDKLKSLGVSDSQLYKMAGNAVTTKVIGAVVKNLKDYLV